MLKIGYKSNGEPTRILCLGAHCDDIEIGCGGSIRQLLKGERDYHITWGCFHLQ